LYGVLPASQVRWKISKDSDIMEFIIENEQGKDCSSNSICRLHC